MKRLQNEDKAGLYITVIFHLLVIAILLIAQIGAVLRSENTFVLDFTKQEEKEKIAREENFREDISRRLEEMIAASEAGRDQVRNIAVDRSHLKDDRGTDARKLYEEAERLQEELDKGKSAVHQEENELALQPVEKDSQEEHLESHYSGPSVLSWELEGRKASRLKVPAYLGMGAGMVTVVITVDNHGNVIDAKVEDAMSSKDASLRKYAINAARASRFSASPTAPARQTGNIVYQFIAQ